MKNITLETLAIIGFILLISFPVILVLTIYFYIFLGNDFIILGLNSEKLILIGMANFIFGALLFGVSMLFSD